jgi:hypothetical protein
MGHRLISGQMFSKQRFFVGGNVATDLATIHPTMLNGCCCNRILWRPLSQARTPAVA